MYFIAYNSFYFIACNHFADRDIYINLFDVVFLNIWCFVGTENLLQYVHFYKSYKVWLGMPT